LTGGGIASGRPLLPTGISPEAETARDLSPFRLRIMLMMARPTLRCVSILRQAGAPAPARAWSERRSRPSTRPAARRPPPEHVCRPSGYRVSAPHRRQCRAVEERDQVPAQRISAPANAGQRSRLPGTHLERTEAVRHDVSARQRLTRALGGFGWLGAGVGAGVAWSAVTRRSYTRRGAGWPGGPLPAPASTRQAHALARGQRTNWSGERTRRRPMLRRMPRVSSAGSS